MAEMRTLIARYTAQAGRGDEVARLLEEMAAAVAADEPECVLYRAARSIEQPDVFILFEEYTGQAALEAHRETPHFRRLIEGAIVPLLDKREREVAVPVVQPGAR
jgi:quinol monooxygenase YgiN